MEKEVKVALVEKFPAFCGLLLLVVLIFMYREELDGYIKRLTSFEIAGISFNFSEIKPPTKELEEELQNFTPDKALENRLKFLSPQLSKATMLVIHDEEIVGEWLAATFRNMGMKVDVGICATESKGLLNNNYDVILSDIKWAQCEQPPRNAIEFLDGIEPPGTNVVFYIENLTGERKEIPFYAHELTNTFDGMIHGVLDVISRNNELVK